MTTPAHLRVALLLGALLALAPACDLEPDVGPATQARCINGDTDPGHDVSYARDIEPMFERTLGGCAKCHDPRAANPVGFTLGGLDLTSYDALLAGGARSGADIVVAGAPCASVLYLKVSAGPPFGERMPRDGPPFLLPDELDLVHDWIAEGARNN